MKADNSNYWAYNKSLQPFANKLRNHGTKAEACLWKYALRASMMRGYPFRRQRPVLNYIADFLNKELKLIIEVDGYSHTWPGATERDAIRQSKLEKAGFKVIRFTDEEILVNMKDVIGKIEKVIIEIEGSGKRLEASPCTPSSEGDGFRNA